MESYKYTCNICNNLYKTSQSLWNHKNKFHKNWSFLPQKNSLVSQDSSNTTHLSSNYTIEKSFICEYCNKNYSRADNLKRHQHSCKKKEHIIKENEILKQQNDVIIQSSKEIKDLMQQCRRIFIAKRRFYKDEDDSSEELC